jgi:hypothetical protein
MGGEKGHDKKQVSPSPGMQVSCGAAINSIDKTISTMVISRSSSEPESQEAAGYEYTGITAL